MTNDELIAQTEQFVRTQLAGEGTGHDWWHAVRVVNTAQLIHKAEGGDWLTIKLALMLHDVGDRKVINQPDDDHSIEENFLVSLDADPVLTRDIMSIITTMSFSKSFDEIEKNDSIEFKIVQDADRLDAIGAIGIGRVFAFGGSRARLLYDPDAESQIFQSSDDYKNSEGSSIQHFYDKLFLLKDRLNTETAKQIAHERDSFMHQFVDKFISEWNGES